MFGFNPRCRNLILFFPNEMFNFRARALPMSTTERDKCSLTSILPMSCRDRAETFARHLHSRLRSLGSEDGDSTTSETSWLSGHENSIAVSHQPRHSSDPELFFNFGLLESPDSPQEEITETELVNLINIKDNLEVNRCQSCKANFNSHDSDSSDGPYYDTETEVHQKITNGIPESVEEDEEDTRQLDEVVENHVSHESPPTTPLNESIYESPPNSEITDLSTLSLRDEDYPSLEYNSANQDVSYEDKPEEVYSSTLSVEKDLTVECPLNACKIPKSESIDKSNTVKESKAFLEVEENDDDKEEEERMPRVRRCSSLKTGKTPPGTPGRKKIVRFADVLGLDLADVRTFLDEIPKVPTSAYDDLVDVDLSSASSAAATQPFQAKPEKILLPLFQQPGGIANFLDKVREKNVCLENAVVSDPIDLSIKGTVRVRNLDFHKSVHIRYTLDSWKTFADLQASYIQNSCDGFSDTFTFLLYAHTLTIGQKLEFAVRFQCKGCQYWDNNYGANYCFQCLPASHNTAYSSTSNLNDHWGASFY